MGTAEVGRAVVVGGVVVVEVLVLGTAEVGGVVVVEVVVVGGAVVVEVLAGMRRRELMTTITIRNIFAQLLSLHTIIPHHSNTPTSIN